MKDVLAPADVALPLNGWFGRFRCQLSPGSLRCVDRLFPVARTLPITRLAGLHGLARTQAAFVAGFVPAALSTVGNHVAAQPRHVADTLFWQYPSRTEGVAWERHASQTEATRCGSDVHVYIGLPWATWIDKARKGHWGTSGLDEADEQTRCTATRLRGLRKVLESLALRLRVHTVCQHVAWQDALPRWEQLGVTDAWLSHCPEGPVASVPADLQLHAWNLLAVNVEDTSRRVGLSEDCDPAQRRWLASFLGAHSVHYLSDVRLRLARMDPAPDVFVELSADWHFEQVVYGEQVRGVVAHAVDPNDAVRRYNQLLCDSVFSLCPPGAGANTVRLWESLAVGSIPVLFEPWPHLPQHVSGASLDWDEAVIRVRDAEFGSFLSRLRSMPAGERRTRSAKARAIYRRTRDLRCF
jgi:hypothetical protein